MSSYGFHRSPDFGSIDLIQRRLDGLNLQHTNVITSRLALLKASKFDRVLLHMAQVSILGQLFFLVRHVDLKIEGGISVFFGERRKLLCVHVYRSRYRHPKLGQQPIVFFARTYGRK